MNEVKAEINAEFNSITTDQPEMVREYITHELFAKAIPHDKLHKNGILHFEDVAEIEMLYCNFNNFRFPTPYNHGIGVNGAKTFKIKNCEFADFECRIFDTNPIFSQKTVLHSTGAKNISFTNSIFKNITCHFSAIYLGLTEIIVFDGCEFRNINANDGTSCRIIASGGSGSKVENCSFYYCLNKKQKKYTALFSDNFTGSNNKFEAQ